MIRPDFRNFRGTNRILVHSAKGSEWENHKYLKKIDGNYYYPVGYKKGRTVDSLPEEVKEDKNKEKTETDGEERPMTEDDINTLALQVIRGDFGNGQIRKDLLGEDYEAIQSKVNELMKAGDYGSISMSSEESNKIAEKGEKVVEDTKKEVTKSTINKGIDMEKVLSVYEKKKKREESIKHSAYLAHFDRPKLDGAKRGSGRYPLGSGDRSYQRHQRFLRRNERIKNRAIRKMNRIDRRVQSSQEEANKQYEKAERKSLSRWSSERSAKKAFERAASAQRDVRKMEYKGSQYYKRRQKKFERRGIDMDPNVRKIGEKYLEDIRQNSQMMYLKYA